MLILKPTEAREFQKAKYDKRWKGPDGKWRYSYGSQTKDRWKKLADDRTSGRTLEPGYSPFIHKFTESMKPKMSAVFEHLVGHSAAMPTSKTTTDIEQHLLDQSLTGGSEVKRMFGKLDEDKLNETAFETPVGIIHIRNPLQAKRGVVKKLSSGEAKRLGLTIA